MKLAPWWVAETNKRAVARSNKFYKIMNENKHKSCHSSSENILFEQSFNSSVTPKPTCNRRLLFCSWLLFRCTTTTTKRHSNCNGLSQTNFTKTKPSRINLQREIKKTRGLTVQFGPDASKAALQQRPTFCAWSLRRWVWKIFLLQVLQLSCSSLICEKNLNVWKRVISLVSLNTTVVFCKKRFSSHNSVC